MRWCCVERVQYSVNRNTEITLPLAFGRLLFGYLNGLPLRRR